MCHPPYIKPIRRSGRTNCAPFRLSRSPSRDHPRFQPSVRKSIYFPALLLHRDARETVTQPLPPTWVQLDDQALWGPSTKTERFGEVVFSVTGREPSHNASDFILPSHLWALVVHVVGQHLGHGCGYRSYCTRRRLLPHDCGRWDFVTRLSITTKESETSLQYFSINCRRPCPHRRRQYRNEIMLAFRRLSRSTRRLISKPFISIAISGIRNGGRSFGHNTILLGKNSDDARCAVGSFGTSPIQRSSAPLATRCHSSMV